MPTPPHPPASKLPRPPPHKVPHPPPPPRIPPPPQHTTPPTPDPGGSSGRGAAGGRAGRGEECVCVCARAAGDRAGVAPVPGAPGAHPRLQHLPPRRQQDRGPLPSSPAPAARAEHTKGCPAPLPATGPAPNTPRVAGPAPRECQGGGLVGACEPMRKRRIQNVQSSNVKGCRSTGPFGLSQESGSGGDQRRSVRRVFLWLRVFATSPARRSACARRAIV